MYFISDYFNNGLKGHYNYNFVDVAVNDDNLLFIDPVLIELAKDQWCNDANATIQSFFDEFYEAYRNNDVQRKIVLLSHAGEQNGTRLGFLWCIGWEKNLRIDYTAFPRVIVRISGFLFFQFGTCPVSRCGNCAFPGTAAEYLNGKMKNRHRTTSPYDIEKPHRRVLLYHFAVSGT